MTNRILSAAVLIPILTIGGFSQTFEVASVKPNRLNDRIVSISIGPGDRFTARGYTLVLLIQRAYGVMDWNVSGGPGWIRDDRFDLNAKAGIPGNLTESQLRPRLASLLAERFKLKLHNITSVMSGYALEVAKGGPRLTPSQESEEQGDSFRMDDKGFRGTGISMPTFARFVVGKLYEVGDDQTGLTGLYDFDIRWTIDKDPAIDRREALRTAVQEGLQKLGLKLTPRKITVRILVIDNVERPTATEN